MSEKKKKHLHPMGTKTFATLWTLTYARAWIMGLAISLIVIWVADSLFQNLVQPPLEIFGFILFGANVGFVSGALQQSLLQRKYGVSIRSWWLWSTLGWMIAFGALYGSFALYVIFIDDEFDHIFQYHLPLALIILGTTFAIPAIIQSVLLKSHVRRVWAFSLAAFVSGAIFFLPPFIGYANESWLQFTLWIIAGLAQWLTMALTLVWLFGMTRTEAVAQNYDTSHLQLKNKHEDENQGILESENRLDELQHHER